MKKNHFAIITLILVSIILSSCSSASKKLEKKLNSIETYITENLIYDINYVLVSDLTNGIHISISVKNIELESFQTYVEDTVKLIFETAEKFDISFAKFDIYAKDSNDEDLLSWSSYDGKVGDIMDHISLSSAVIKHDVKLEDIRSTIGFSSYHYTAKIEQLENHIVQNSTFKIDRVNIQAMIEKPALIVFIRSNVPNTSASIVLKFDEHVEQITQLITEKSAELDMPIAEISIRVFDSDDNLLTSEAIILPQ